ncbi:MAG: hypothetical protein ACFNYD_04465 [Bacteroides sp.]
MYPRFMYRLSARLFAGLALCLTALHALGQDDTYTPTLDTTGATYRYFELFRQQLFDSANDETLYRQLRKAESSFPQEGEYPRWLSGLYSDSGMLDSAVACMKRAVACDSSNLYYLKSLHDLYVEQRGDPKEMTSVAQRMVALAPNRPDLWYALVVDYMRANQTDSAIAICQRLRGLLASTYTVDLIISSAFHMKGQPDSTLAYAIRNANAHYQLAEANYYVTEVAANLRKDSLAQLYFAKGLQLDCPKAPFLLTHLRYLCEIGKPENALTTLRKVDSLCPLPDSVALRIIGLFMYSVPPSMLAQKENQELMEALFDKLPMSNDAIIAKFRFYELVKERGKSRQLIAHLSDLYPNDYFLWAARMEIEQLEEHPLTLENWSEKTSTLRYIMRQFPHDIAAPLNYLFAVQKLVGAADERLVDSTEAIIDAYAKDLKNSNKTDQYQYYSQDSVKISMPKRLKLRENLSILYSYLGDIEIGSKRYKNGWKAYEKALKYNDSNALACNNFAYYIALYRPQKLSKAKRLSEKSLALDPKNPSYLDTYGYILYLQGDLESAKAVFTELLTLQRNPGRTALLHYSEVLRALGNEQAAEVYRLKAQYAADLAE